MKVKEINYAEVKQYANRAAKDRVSISNTNNTKWYAIIGDDEDIVGVAGLMLLSSAAARIKGVWVCPLDRGHGYGTALTLLLIKEAQKLKMKRLEALAYNPSFYVDHGWYKTGNPRPNGAQRVEVLL